MPFARLMFMRPDGVESWSKSGWGVTSTDSRSISYLRKTTVEPPRGTGGAGVVLFDLTSRRQRAGVPLQNRDPTPTVFPRRRGDRSSGIPRRESSPSWSVRRSRSALYSAETKVSCVAAPRTRSWSGTGVLTPKVSNARRAILRNAWPEP